MSFAQIQMHPRYRTQANVELLLADGTRLHASADNISQGGLFVKTDPALLALGARLRVILSAPAPPVELAARVVHVLDETKAAATQHAAGVGLEFEALPDTAGVLLQRFLYNLFRDGKRIPVATPGPAPSPTPDAAAALLQAADLLTEVLTRPRAMATGVLEERLERVESALGLVDPTARVATKDGPIPLLEALGRLRTHLGLRRAEDHAAPGNSDAVRTALEAVQRWPARPIQMRAIDVLSRCGDHAGVAAVCRQVVVVHPKDQVAWRILLATLQKLEAWTEADRAVGQLLELCPDDKDVLARRELIRTHLPSAPPPPAKALALRAGDVMGRYVILEKLGQGGMAEVWLARQEGPSGFAKTMVIKTISPAWARDPVSMQLFLDEARLAAQLNHSNIVQIFELGEHQGLPFLVMEHLDGRTVGQLLAAAHDRGAALPPLVAARLMGEACAALAYAHTLRGEKGRALGIVHRDVSPENIFLTYQGHVKLLDFGIARASQNTHQTNPGTIRGKIPYLSPEQVRAEGLDQRTDVWAVGVCLYVLLTSRLPFAARTELDTLMSIVQGYPPTPRQLRPDVPEELDAVVMKALQKHPADRFQSASEMRAALEACLLAQPVSAFALTSLMETLFPVDGKPSQHPLAGLVVTPPQPAQLPEPQSVSETDDPMAEVTVQRPIEVMPDDLVAQTALRPSPQALTPEAMPLDLSATPRSGGVKLAGVAAARPAAQAPKRAQPKSLPRALVMAALATAVLGLGTAGILMTRAKDPPRVDPSSAATAAKGTVPSQASTTPLPVVPSARPPAPPPLELGTLKVDSNVPADVFVDGQPVGSAPVTVRKLAVGDHELKLVGHGGKGTRVFTVPVVANVTTRRRVAMGKGKLDIKVSPWAVVSVDGRRVGTTPLSDQTVWEGRHVVTLVNPDLGVERHVPVDVQAGGVAQVRVKLGEK